MSSRWPSTLWIVRHGQSAGNVARDAAEANASLRIELTGRDVDVPLSSLGEEQARALGEWFRAGHEDGRPEVLLASPYRRAVQTAQFFRDSGGCDADEAVCIDERLREKEFGIFDGLTTAGIRQILPEQAEFRRLLGKFYHRPPGGESWADVILRLRSVLDMISLHHSGQRVMIVAHQVVVLCLRYIIENMDEQGILDIDHGGDVANCSVTEYRYEEEAGKTGKLVLQRYNATAPMRASETPVTSAVDVHAAARG